MKDIQFNKSITKEEWETLHNTYIDEWNFAMPVRNALMRNGFRTVGDVIDMSDKELGAVIRTIRSQNPEITYKKKMEQVRNQLKERNIVLPTEEEKQNIIDSLSEKKRGK